jgi:hypothetical protein
MLFFDWWKFGTEPTPTPRPSNVPHNVQKQDLGAKNLVNFEVEIQNGADLRLFITSKRQKVDKNFKN